MKKYVQGLVGMLSIFALMIISLRAVARSTDLPPDSILANAENLIGQPIEVAEELGLACTDHHYTSSDEEECGAMPVAGTVSELRMIESQGVVREIALTIREDTSKVGHLIWLWGRPSIRVHERWVFLRWNQRGIYALVPCKEKNFSITLPVWKVYFTDILHEPVQNPESQMRSE